MKSQTRGVAMMKSLATRLLIDEQGGEVMETALVLGLICLTAIGIMGKVGHSVFLKWTDLADQM